VDFHAAFELNKGIAQTFIQRALILSFQRKYQLIIQEYDERKKKYNLVTDDPALLLLVAKARIRDGDYQGALTDLNMASEQARDDPQISLQKGICYEFLKDWGNASNEFSKCLEQMPTFSKAFYHRAICKLAQNNPSAELDLASAIELEPNYFDAYITRAGLHTSRGHYNKGISDCDESLKIEPLSIRAHILRGFCKTQLKEYHAGSIDFSKAIAIDKVSSC
jgi:tetratricopeptide (TPR) repeat protein